MFIEVRVFVNESSGSDMNVNNGDGVIMHTGSPWARTPLGLV